MKIISREEGNAISFAYWLMYKVRASENQPLTGAYKVSFAM